MSEQIITISLPDSLFQHLNQRANRAKRSLEDETVAVLTQALPSNAKLDDGLEEDLNSLVLLDDRELRNAAGSRLPEEISVELEALNHKQQRHGLDATEKQRQMDLIRQYERHLLIRSQSVALLKNRGLMTGKRIEHSH